MLNIWLEGFSTLIFFLCNRSRLRGGSTRNAGISAIAPATKADVMPPRLLHVQKQDSLSNGLREACALRREASTYNGRMMPQAVEVIV